MKPFAILLAATALSACSTGEEAVKAPEAPLHSRMLVLDTHLDTPLHFERQGWSFADRHGPTDDMVQIDIPRMQDGNLDGGFFVIYTEQGALDAKGYADALAFARARSDLIDATIARHSNLIGAARTVADARTLTKTGKLIAFKSMENSYPLGEDLALLAEFHQKGVRMAGPVHSRTNQFADSATGEARWNGLSPLGKRWVAEMNRLGIVIDASHASDAAFDQLLALSEYPIILSHSSLRSTNDHPRNLDEARLKALAAKGGAMCISTIFMSDMNMTPARAALFGQYERIGTLAPAEQAELNRKWRALDKVEPLWAADFEQYMTMVLRAIEVGGVDHICFGADWDGGGGLTGIEDISALPKVTERLKAAGYSDGDIEKMWSGNILRILAAQQAR
ncbi:dipeptidase [Sphingopyxis sp. L1A2A]|uniref:dipeptidase n=1 Tax=Sphingopyxis sp. L1A2A TaxID=2502247 RepID=UPI0010FA0719|nr:dipeptidase [Sphingopyxis sp. L1A2A]